MPNLLLQLVNTAVQNWQVGAEDIATNCDLNSLVDLRYLDCLWTASYLILYLESKTNKTNTRFQYQAKKHYMTMQSVYNLHLCIKKSWLLWEYRFQKCAHRIKNSLNCELNSPKGFVRCLKLLEIWYQYRTKTLDLFWVTSLLPLQASVLGKCTRNQTA